MPGVAEMELPTGKDKLWLSYSNVTIFLINIVPQEVGGTLIGEDGIKYIKQRIFKVFDAIPCAPFQTLL